MSELPRAGWYPDPERDGAVRWWDGRQWAPSGSVSVPHGGEFDEPGEIIGRGFRRMRAHWPALVVIAVITAVPTSLLSTWSSRTAEGLVWIDGDFQGSNGGSDASLASALSLASGVISLVGLLATTILFLRVIDRTSDVGSRAVLGAAVEVAPRAIGWILVTVLCAGAIIAVAAIITILVLPIGILVLVGLVPLAFYVVVRLAWLMYAIADQPGAPWRRSAAVSTGRFWGALGRLLLVGLVAFGLSLPFQIGVAAAGIDQGGILNGISIEDNDAGETVVSLGAAGDIGAVDYIVNAVVAVILAVIASGFATAALAEMYRTPRRS